jgi:crotonobetainyl-CoA:carnitine CoA-transferase CaiB-like acyl-CoA transferase
VQTVSGVADQMGATILAMGIMAALLARERTGAGQRVDASLLGSMLHLQSMGIGVTGFRGKSWVKHARKKARNPLTNHYRCADDKWILFSEIQADRFWPEFCRALGLDDLIDDPKFATAMGGPDPDGRGGRSGRRENAFELIDIIDRTLATKPRDEWVARFEEMKVPFAYSPVQDYYEVFEDPQVLANDYITEFEHPTGGPDGRSGKVKVMGYPWRFSETPAQIAREAPEFGQHTEEVLGEMLGLSFEDVASLREQGVV